VCDIGAVALRILMIRLSAIGDVINTLPSVSLLRDHLPDAFVAFAVEDKAKDVVVGHPELDRVFVFPRRRWRAMLASANPRQWWQLVREVRAFALELRAERFDVALDFQGSLKGTLELVLSRAPRRIGFARGFTREGADWFATEHVRPPATSPHRVDKFASLCAVLGATSSKRRYVLPPSPSSRSRVRSFLEQAGLVARRFAIVHPGTSEHGVRKRWPAERFGELAARMVDELAMASVVTFGPGEESLAREVATASGGRAIVAPEGSLLDLAELIRYARLFVSGDTGPMHLAAACGTCCVALFGPKDPAVYGPYGEGHVVIHRPDTNGVPGMLLIGVDDVWSALRLSLEETEVLETIRRGEIGS
jgi:lipopolysaccharide heptosyltransferase I